MRIAALSKSFLAALLMILCLAQIAQASPRNLLACTGDHSWWIARVDLVKDVDPPFDRTTPMVKSGFGGNWSALPEMEARAVCLTCCDEQLIAVLDDGQWMYISDSTRGGPPLPAGARMLAAAGDGEQLWAIGLASADNRDSVESAHASVEMSPTTAPLTEAAATRMASVGPSTLPTTLPAPRQLMLYRYASSGAAGSDWKVIAAFPEALANTLPDGATSLADHLSMAVIGHAPYVAWLRADGSIQVIHQIDRLAWSDPVTITPSSPLNDFKLLSINGEATIWTVGTSRAGDGQNPPIAIAGELRRGPAFGTIVPLVIPGKSVIQDAGPAITVAFDRLRLLIASEDSLSEQAYELDGKPVAEVQTIATPGPPAIPLQTWIGGGAMLLAFSSAAGLSRRRHALANPPQANARMQLAPLGTRIAAGMLDLLPLIAIWYAINSGDNVIVAHTFGQLLAIFAMGAGTYILYTVIAEVLCGQSIGKMVFGLQVVTVNAEPPTMKLLLIRNALRVADFAIFPLMMIAFTPLHQRFGDWVAGSVVAVKEPAPRQETEADDD